MYLFLLLSSMDCTTRSRTALRSSLTCFTSSDRKSCEKRASLLSAPALDCRMARSTETAVQQFKHLRHSTPYRVRRLDDSVHVRLRFPLRDLLVEGGQVRENVPTCTEIVEGEIMSTKAGLYGLLHTRDKGSCEGGFQTYRRSGRGDRRDCT